MVAIALSHPVLAKWGQYLDWIVEIYSSFIFPVVEITWSCRWFAYRWPANEIFLLMKVK